MKCLFSICLCLYGLFVFAQTDLTVDAMGFSSYQNPFVEVLRGSETFFYFPAANLLVDEIDNSTGDMISAMKDGKYGAVHANGQLLADFEYDDIQLVDSYQGQWYEGIPYDYEFVITRKAGQYGVVDASGRVISIPQYDEIKVIDSLVIGIRRGAKWGWISAKDGSLLQEPIYDAVEKNYILQGLVTIYRGEKEGMAKASGEVIIAPEYDFLRARYTHSNTYVLYKQNGKYGLIDGQGKTILSAEYEALESLGNVDLVEVKQGALCGALDLEGNWIIPARYQEIGTFVKGLAIIKGGNKWGVVNAQGKWILPPEYDAIEFQNVQGQRAFAEQAAVLPPLAYGAEPTPDLLKQRAKDEKIAQLPYWILAAKNQEIGLFNWKGEALLPIGKFDVIKPFYRDNKGYFHVSAKDSSGIYDAQGREMLSLQAHVQVDEYDTHEGFLTLSDGPKKGLFDLQKRTFVFPMAEQDIRWVGDHYVELSRPESDGSYGKETALYHTDGVSVIPFDPAIQEIDVIDDQLFLIEAEDRMLKLVDRNGKTVYEKSGWRNNVFLDGYQLPSNENPDAHWFQSGLLKIAGDETNLFIDKQGKEHRFEGYDFISSFYHGRAFALKKKDEYTYHYGMIDTLGKLIVPLELDEINDVYDHPGLLLVRKNGYEGLMDWEGRFLFEPIYEQLYIHSSNPYIDLQKDGKKGLGQLDGKIIVQPIYEELHTNEKGDDKVWPLLVKEGEWFRLLDQQGKAYPIKAHSKIGY